MSPTVIVRPAEREDGPFVARVLRASFPLYDPLLPAFGERLAAKYESGDLPHDHALSIVEAGGREIGFAGTAELDRRTAYLHSLYLLPEAQRQGHGSRALARVLGDFAARGFAEVALLAHERATWATAFYARHGFRIVTFEPAAIRAFQGGALATRWVLPDAPFVLMTRALVEPQALG